MSTDAIRLTIVTTRAAEACLAVLGVSDPPSWCRVVTRPEDVERLPGGRCLAVWFEPRAHRSVLEWLWLERRTKGGITGLAMEEIDGLKAWSERHAAPPAPASLRLDPSAAKEVWEYRI
jgi:hypothetical protein